MSHDVRVLCRPEVAAGFGLTGIAVTGATSTDEASAMFRQWLDDPEVGVVLLEQDFHDTLPDDLRLRLRRHPLPLVVPFPGPSRAAAPEAEAYIVELLRQVIGYRVRLR